MAATWSWWERDAWNPLDLRTLDWETTRVRPGTARRAPSGSAARGSRCWSRMSAGAGRSCTACRGEWRPGSPLRIAIPAILFTVGVLVVDAARTSSWTVIRQNLESVAGDPGCGLADDVLVSRRASARPLAIVGRPGAAGSPPRGFRRAPRRGLPRFVLGPAGSAPRLLAVVRASLRRSLRHFRHRYTRPLGHALDRMGARRRRHDRAARKRRDHRGRERAVRERALALLLRRRSPRVPLPAQPPRASNIAPAPHRVLRWQSPHP